ncbi:hypothetical protein H1S01_03055 [Heliobacterium chlorum]|uniref:Uncharacterized protein n=1 Tax=Heliobacterium chlorum TaxID=2698 RepID=A0ABR7T0W9_HELCL|nr:hypothetical protein [Heliobacterium chlorum]MBC9783489.1 hypothetical protein [Heliobacterium chlorum]
MAILLFETDSGTKTFDELTPEEIERAREVIQKGITAVIQAAAEAG